MSQRWHDLHGWAPHKYDPQKRQKLTCMCCMQRSQRWHDLHCWPPHKSGKKKKRKDKDLFVCVVCKCHKDGMTLLKIWVSVSAGSVGSETGGVARETNHLTHSQKQAHRGWHLQASVVCPGWCPGLYQSLVRFFLWGGGVHMSVCLSCLWTDILLRIIFGPFPLGFLYPVFELIFC